MDPEHTPKSHQGYSLKIDNMDHDTEKNYYIEEKLRQSYPNTEKTFIDAVFCKNCIIRRQRGRPQKRIKNMSDLSQEEEKQLRDFIERKIHNSTLPTVNNISAFKVGGAKGNPKVFINIPMTYSDSMYSKQFKKWSDFSESAREIKFQTEEQKLHSRKTEVIHNQEEWNKALKDTGLLYNSLDVKRSDILYWKSIGASANFLRLFDNYCKKRFNFKLIKNREDKLRNTLGDEKIDMDEIEVNSIYFKFSDEKFPRKIFYWKVKNIESSVKWFVELNKNKLVSHSSQPNNFLRLFISADQCDDVWYLYVSLANLLCPNSVNATLVLCSISNSRDKTILIRKIINDLLEQLKHLKDIKINLSFKDSVSDDVESESETSSDWEPFESTNEIIVYLAGNSENLGHGKLSVIDVKENIIIRQPTDLLCVHPDEITKKSELETIQNLWNCSSCSRIFSSETVLVLENTTTQIILQGYDIHQVLNTQIAKQITKQ